LGGNRGTAAPSCAWGVSRTSASVAARYWAGDVAGERRGLKRVFEAENQRDVEAVIAELAPDVEWHAALPLLGGDAVYRGHERVREFLPEIWDVLADTKFECPDIRDVGDQVVALGHFRGRGEASAVPTERSFAYVVDFKGGKATRLRAFLDLKAALEAAGA
jgi:ketosteroid isomerase-like protein